MSNCEMCRNYELQLQIVQCNEEDMKAEVQRAQANIKSLKEEIKKEQRSKNELEDKFMEEAKVTESKLKECSERLDTANRHVAELRGNQFVYIQSMNHNICFSCFLNPNRTL